MTLFFMGGEREREEMEENCFIYSLPLPQFLLYLYV